MKKLIILLFIILTSTVLSKTKIVDCKKHPIFCQIKKNKKTMQNSKAMHLSNIIYKVSKKYDINSNILTAIFAQESGYNISAMNCRTGIKRTALEDGKIKEVEVCFDFGIGQINWKNIKKRKLDIIKIINDYEYSVDIAGLILYEFKKSFKKWDESYWTRYNARNAIKRELYKKLVERYF